MADDSRPGMIRSDEHLRNTGRDLRLWACSNCGMELRAPAPPGECPQCHAPGRDFTRS